MPMIQVDQQTAENRKILYLLQRYCSEEAVFADCKNGDKLRKPFQDVVTALQAEIEKDEPDTETVFMIESRMMQFINRLHHPDANGYHDYDAEAAVAYLDKYHNLNGKHKDVLANKQKKTEIFRKNSFPLRIISYVSGGTGLLCLIPAYIIDNHQPNSKGNGGFLENAIDSIKYNVFRMPRPDDVKKDNKIFIALIVAIVILILISILSFLFLTTYKRNTMQKLSDEEKQAKDRLNELGDIRSAFENVSKMISELEEY